MQELLNIIWPPIVTTALTILIKIGASKFYGRIGTSRKAWSNEVNERVSQLSAVPEARFSERLEYSISNAEADEAMKLGKIPRGIFSWIFAGIFWAISFCIFVGARLALDWGIVDKSDESELSALATLFFIALLLVFAGFTLELMALREGYLYKELRSLLVYLISLDLETRNMVRFCFDEVMLGWRKERTSVIGINGKKPGRAGKLLRHFTYTRLPVDALAQNVRAKVKNTLWQRGDQVSKIYQNDNLYMAAKKNLGHR